MQHYLTIDEISRRAKVIGYEVKDLAADASVHETTVYRSIGRESNNTMKTMQRLSAALFTRERRLRDHLLALHPLASAEVERSEAAA